MTRLKSPAIFLDRDGTLNVEKDYLYKIEDFEFIPGAEKAIRQLKEAGFLVVVVTNQSGIGRGYYEQGDVIRLHEYIQEELRRLNTEIDAFYFCPHHPEKGMGEYRKACNCRKGAPGMLLQAATEHNIDLQRSYMIGDKLADIEAGEAAGCNTILVSTGYGARTRNLMEQGRTVVAKDLLAASELIVSTIIEKSGE